MSTKPVGVKVCICEWGSVGEEVWQRNWELISFNSILLLFSINRILSSATSPVGDAVSALLSPAFEVVAEAHKRPYLSPRSLRASLEIVKTTIKLALGGSSTADQLQRGII